MTEQDEGEGVKRTGTGQREHHWDAMRALLMVLGIPYHVALAYQIGDGSGQAWIVNAHEGATGFASFARFIHLFRMPAFFIVAGYFASLLLARRAPMFWLRGRFQRLGIPFLACLLLLNPLLNLACELSNFALGPAIVSLLHNSATSGGYWIRHLWFLIVLLYFCMAVALLFNFAPQLRGKMVSQRFDRWCAHHFILFMLAMAGLVGMWEAVSIEAFYAAGLATNGPQQIMRLDEVLIYAPWFLIGCVVARTPLVRERLYGFSMPVTLAAIALTVTSLVLGDRLGSMTVRCLDAIAALALAQLLIALCSHFARRANPVTDKLVDASFAIYLVHLPIITWLVVVVRPIAMPVAMKALLVMMATFILSWLAALLIARVPVLRLLFDGRKPLPETGAPVPDVAIPPSPALCRDRRSGLRPSLP